MNILANITLVILITHGFEKSEVILAKKMLEKQGAAIIIVAPDGKVLSWHNNMWSNYIVADILLKDALSHDISDYDGLILPGGILNVDALRMNKDAIAFIQKFVDQHKLIAAICHGPWALIETNALRGKRVTSWESLKTDLKNAGANWLNAAVTSDSNIITSRESNDVPAFIQAIINYFRPKNPLP